MANRMNMKDLLRVNQLWGKIYPYLAGQILEYYQGRTGNVLEWGPFSGEISFALLAERPDLKIQIAVEEENVRDLLSGEMAARGFLGKIKLVKSGLIPMAFDDNRFDLVVIRGGYFFLDAEGESLKEIFRVLKPDGIGFIGGGYGKSTPQPLIDEIAEESRMLNDRLGRIRVTVDDLKAMIGKSGLGEHIRIIEEGGLWLLIKK